MRFSIVQIKDGPWIVVDRQDHRRRIASCVNEGAAEMIAALMNGDLDRAIAGREALAVPGLAGLPLAAQRRAAA